jgi:hypothetical protein
MDRAEPQIVWDRWQRDVIAHAGNIVMRTGRQVGKSQVLSYKVFRFAVDNPGVTVLCIAPALRQSSFIYDKIVSWFDAENERLLMEAMGERRLDDRKREALALETSLYSEIPTRTKICLKNGSKIYSFPAGRTGIFIMGMTIDVLVPDEAAFIPEIVWNSVLPMLAVSRKMRGFGYIWMASIPFWKGGFFYDCSHDKDFREWHISSEDCPRISRSFLAKEKGRLSKSEYNRIYRGEYVDEFNQFFPTELILRACTFLEWTKEKEYDPFSKRYYLGVDIARYGGDENAFVVAEMDRRDLLKIVKVQTTSRISTTDTIGRILHLDQEFNFRKIFIDDAGVGGGVTDILLEKKGRKIVGLNNASRSVDHEGKQRAILKEDLYSNLLVLLENQRLTMINSLALQKSLKSINFEYTADLRLKIKGEYSHIAEACVRACWCVREKGLKVYIA